MRKAVAVVVAIMLGIGVFTLAGCGPSTKELLEQKTKENQDLQTKVTDLEKQVKKLTDELATCQEDFKNLLYYNREKGAGK